jgi:SAM-dependent methyltransferase
MDKKYDFPHAGIHKFVIKYIESLPDLTGKVVVDIPCGDGRASLSFKKRGATIKALDLYPEFVKVEGVEPIFADLSERLPLEDSCADYLICQEGIEHISDKVRMFQEFNRVLKKGGTLIITAPSISHARGRLSMFLVESDLWRRSAPNEMDSVWFSEGESDRQYFGHLFLIGVHHLLTICTLCGFETVERRKTKVSSTSVILGILFYPFIALMTLTAYHSYKKKNKHVEKSRRYAILWERVTLNLSATTMFRRHIFWVLRKDKELSEALADIKKLTRGR